MPAGLLNEATLSAYNPSWRDKLATWIMGNQKASPEKRQFVGGLLGSTGLGSTGASVSDFTPVGGLLGAQEAAQRGDMKGMALAALPMPAKAASGVLNAVEREAPHIIAYHGSPHSFDRFDLSKIGTGEGAQAYGHGLYFADNEDVARGYRDRIAGAQYVDSRGVPMQSNQIAEAIIGTARKNGMGLLEAEELGFGWSQYLNNPDAAPAPVAEVLKKHGLGVKSNGSMYQVRINADPEHFLDWDRPLSEHPEVIRRKLGWTPEAEAQYRSAQSADDDALLAALNDEGSYQSSKIPVPSGLPPLSATGEDIVRGRSVFDRASDVEKANRLRELGIPGLKYLDQGSRGAGEGSRNYVVFDDKLIDILKKYGLGGILGGGAAYGAMNGANQLGGPEL